MVTDTVHFSLIPVVSDETYNITATLTGYNGKEIVGGIPFEVTVNKNIVTTEGDKFVFLLVTDRYASQTSFAFFDSNGNIVKKGGPYTNLQNNGTTERQFVFEPPASGCYKLEVYDTGGNGINSGNGAGYFKFSDIDGNAIFYNDGKFGYQANYYLNITKLSSINKTIDKDEISLYPNPVSDILYIDTKDIVMLEISNLQGQSIICSDSKEINVSKLSSGIYLIKIYTEKGLTVKKFVKI